MVSAVPPGGNPIIIRIGRSGYVCAFTEAGLHSAVPTASMLKRRLLNMATGSTSASNHNVPC